MSFMDTQEEDNLGHDETNAFKILIATDNHIGYLEGDPVRGQDSFTAFEEILKIGQEHNVDFVLLGGDLFHHNRPSRSCLYQTMRMLRRYCFGDKESQVWIASDQSVNFADQFCKANYLDDNLNISMPVFSIHGNHDDPSGVGNLCALHLLSAAGMVNYFGASHSVDQVLVHPILMQKGASRLALYGLGNIREERLHRQWSAGKVKFMRPAPDDDDWRHCFNMFVFHQNRARHGPTSHIPEEFLDEFIDLVVWGHEHECRIFPEEREHFSITQPGSSVATSLSSGEAEPKHVGILTVEGNRYSLDKIPLRTVRPLQFTSVSLHRVDDLLPSDVKGTQTYLEGVVETLIERAKNEWEERGLPDMEMPIPLIRIRVDYTGGYETFNPQQFGQNFIKRVANPKDMLKFQRDRAPTARGLKPSEMLADLSTAIPERLDALKVEDLVHELLKKDLLILSEQKLEQAVISLVEKNDKEAIKRFVKRSIMQTQQSIQQPEDIADLTEEYIKRKSQENKQSQDTQQQGIAVSPIPSQQGNTVINNDDDVEEEQVQEDEIEHSPSPPPTATRGRGRGRGRGGASRGGKKRAATRSPSTSPSPSPPPLQEPSTGKRRRVLPSNK